MNYEIHIQDMENLSDPLIVHFASRDSISLQYEGGEDPDKVIDGSTATFDLETLYGEDFKYGQYFTSNEKKWQVTWVRTDTQEIIWRGFILPETFTEPYDSPLFYTEFEAVCGLGLLKGKQLPDSFYSEEKTVIEVISACLKLTQIDFDIYLAPAIYNLVQENWNTIYVDMLKYEDEDKRPSAYEILDEFLFSKLCKVYQCEGRWEIKGFNQINLPKNKFYKYDINGNFLGTQVIERNIKEIKYFVNGPASVSMVPALGRLTVSHESPKVEFPTGVYKEEDVDWIFTGIQDARIYPREWFIHGNWEGSSPGTFLPRMTPPDYYLELNGRSGVSGFRPQNYLELREKPYILKGTGVQISLRVKFLFQFTNIISENYDRGNFQDVLQYRVKMGDDVIFSTLQGNEIDPIPVSLDASGTGTINLVFIAGKNDFLNIEIWEPYIDELFGTASFRLQIDELTVENIRQRNNDVIELVIDENSSVIKEIDLPISNDVSAKSKNFMLEPIRDLDPVRGRMFKAPVLYGYTLNGNHYSIIELKYAVLIEQYPTEIRRDNPLEFVRNPEVIYNFNGTTEMAIKTEVPYIDGNFFIYVRPLAEPTTDRLDWLKWTDAVYGVEDKPYLEVVAEIYRRVFQVPRLKLSGTAEVPLKYNDLMKFTYNGEERFFAFSNLEWRPSGGTGVSTFTAFEAFYDGVSVGNIPPYVYAGPDIQLTGFENRVQITEAIANDPDGDPLTILWERINVPPGTTLAEFSNANALNPEITNLVLDQYEFRLTATDSAGNSASDILVISRPSAYQMTVDNFQTIVADGPEPVIREYFRFDYSPALPAGAVLLAEFNVNIDLAIDKGTVYGFATTIYKNGVITYNFGSGLENYNYTGYQNFNESGSFQIEESSDIEIVHLVQVSNNFKGSVSLKMILNSVEFINVPGASIAEPFPTIVYNHVN